MSAMAEHEQWQVALAWSVTVLWYICWPIGIILYYLVFVAIFLAKLLYRPVGFLLQPIVYLGRFTAACIAAPFQLLARLETLYIYLGIAALVGLGIGFGVSYVYGSLARLLRFDREPEKPSRKPTRTAKHYRETKRKVKVAAETPRISSPPLSSPEIVTAGTISPPLYVSASDGIRKARRTRGLLNQIIREEADSDF
ncbi:hypothetical protein EJ03DRAFT_174048 [Teratosphaeria nubilosa]|uniref:Uncharacterized protein n=1 Tax=Teratosphaeria nubilosa TaxID=161662 RepID=A0A6G1L1M1_9PEZI|nr:hypothetical protein EJ03DRAFT_174048 [Teratosphaeria nubilosa]